MDKERSSKIGQDFNLGSLLKFALPGLLTSLSSRLFETLDDALFVSRFVGQNALAGIKFGNEGRVWVAGAGSGGRMDVEDAGLSE